MQLLLHRAFIPVVLLVGLHNSAALAAATPLTQLKSALDQGQFEQAYALAQSQFETAAGDAEFDFLYARAALETGHYNEAVFALERVLAVKPNHQSSLYLLGLTYNKQKNYPQAASTLNSLLATSLSDEFRQRVERALDAIEDNQASMAQQLKHRVSLALGHDSNVNSGTTDDRIVIGGLPILLDDSSREASDAFARTSYRFDGRWQQTQHQAWQANIQLSDQRHQDSDEFDRTQLSTNVSYVQDIDDLQLHVGAQLGVMSLDSETYQQDAGVFGALRYTIDEHWAATLNISAFNLNNVRDSELDSRLYTSGFAISRAARNWLVRVSAGYTWQPAEEPAAEHYARDYAHLSAALVYRLNDAHRLNARIQYRDIEHRAAHPFFLQVRDETLHIAHLGWVYQITPAWGLETKLAYYDKDSSLQLYSYDRTEWSLGVHYDF
ncbi:tetratricopeptide repeat protein [Pseudoalteromonas viridis]|uniref:Tetratricopeptide repeat protein n=1 Tax=Pseudoalteromonas viridis TaxID=339617 RepID=A0ABX7V688_9GAMM|nr:tetratricopeptide repeat protein [Pseudoalteromonas viridis]QTL36403.1 tetratricopeptide repeat protein [Pseudoalteromonas viridis]